MNANLTKDPMDLARVAMPLVRLLRDAHLSWSQKVEIATVIYELCRERKDWEAEAAHISGGFGGAGMGQSSGNGVAL